MDLNAVSGDADALNQSLVCASDSYKFNVESNVSETAGGVLRGSWAETTRNATGQLVGRVGGSHIVANVQGVGFTATISIVTRGRSQSSRSRRAAAPTSLVSMSVCIGTQTRSRQRGLAPEPVSAPAQKQHDRRP